MTVAPVTPAILRPLLCAVMFTAGAGLIGCGTPTAPGVSEEDVEVVPDGKEDNYFSTHAREYFFEGTVRVVIEDELLDKSAGLKLARARELAELKTIGVGWFLNVRLTDKEQGAGEHGDPNAQSYPGYHAIVRTGEWTIADLHALADGKTYSYKLKLQVAGQRDLIAELPGTLIKGGKKRMPLAIGKVSNETLTRLDVGGEWFREDPWGSGKFDPAKLSADQLETIDLTISTQPESSDAFLDLKRLYADGKLSIDAHYGHDYWARYDIANARDLYQRLLAQGFTSPSSSFASYRGDLGPLTRTMTLGGSPVEVAVRIYHGSGKDTVGFDPDTDEGGLQMEAAMYDSLANSDVILFSGHAGQYYGFALANWKKTAKGSLDYPQLSTAKMPNDRYQLVLSSGCNTFSTGQAFRDNPNKPDLANLNVITTNTFSNAASNEEVMAVLDALYGGDAARFAPRPISSLLEEMNGPSTESAMYGLHGIDPNPRLHPFARLDTLGKTCTQNAECGDAGNRCTKVGTKRFCSATCLSNSACPTGFRCKSVAATGTTTVVGKQCLK